MKIHGKGVVQEKQIVTVGITICQPVQKQDTGRNSQPTIKIRDSRNRQDKMTGKETRWGKI